MGAGTESNRRDRPAAMTERRRHVVVRRAACLLLCGGIALLPFAWREGCWWHWRRMQPRVGEPIDDVVARFGEPSHRADGLTVISFSTPDYWVIPSCGQLTLRCDEQGRVASWDVKFR